MKKTKTLTNQGTKISFPGDRRRQSAQPPEEISAPENLMDLSGAPKPKLPNSTKPTTAPEDRNKEREGPKPRTRSAEGQRGRNPSPPPTSVSDGISAKRREKVLPDNSSQRSESAPPSPSKSTKSFKRVRVASQVLAEDQVQPNISAPKSSLKPQQPTFVCGSVAVRLRFLTN